MSIDTRTNPVEAVAGDLDDDFLAAAAESRLVAVDIETTGLEWATNRIATCQFAVAGGPCAVVVRPTPRPGRVLRLLSDPTVTKVFHYALFDLRFIVHHWRAEPRAIACTKVASKLLTPGRKNHSLKPLLLEYLGVEIDKSLQTSDWARPDLTPEQLAYAVADVVHLPALLDSLGRRLADAGLADLYRRCLDHIPTRVALELGDYPDVFAY